MGDCMKALSNGRIWNGIHRMIMEKCETPRVSLPYFYSFSDESDIHAPLEFIDENHPRLYKPFKHPEFRAFYGQISYKNMQEHLDHIIFLSLGTGVQDYGGFKARCAASWGI